MSRRLFIVTLACRAADPLVASNGAGEEYLWSIVKAGGYVIFIRHALTDQGVGDPPGFNLKNCDTQRNRYRATDEHQFDKKNPQVIQSPGVCSWRKRSPYNYVSHVDSNTNKTLNVSMTYGSKSMKRTSPSRIERIPSAQLVLVAIAVKMLQPKGFGRIRIKQIREGDYESLMPFIQEAVCPGSLIHSDGSAAYRNIEEHGYQHSRTVHLGSDTPAHESMSGVHRVAALLHRWLLGTHHGAVQPGQLDYYLDKFVFRFNRRTSASRGLLFYRLLQQAVVTKPVTYSMVANNV